MRFIFPFKDERRITSPYGRRIHPVTHQEQYHNGIDIAAPVGTQVLAVCDGMVLRIWEDDLNGKALRLIDSNGVYRIGYAHLDEILTYVGQAVKCGDVIALSGNTGRSSGPHLHVTISACVGWETHDPEPFLCRLPK